MSGSRLSDMFSDQELGHADTLEDLLSIIENFEEASKGAVPFTPFQETAASPTPTDEAFATLVSKGPATTSSVRPRENDDGDGSDDDGDDDASQARKKLKFAVDNGEHKISHITVERNRRKQMNEHLTVLRSIMPCFYVKRGDQASIIGGVVDYIKELQQLLQSLESKKQRKVMSPRPVSSPRPSPLSPRPSPLSPRVGLPISPRTPQPGSPYKPRLMQQQQQQHYIVSPAISPYNEPSPSLEAAGEVAANSKSAMADVEVKFSGPNLVVKTVSHRIPGQAMKIITALEGLPLEILQVNISTIDETLLNSFTIKIGIECELSAEELAQEIQQTFL